MQTLFGLSVILILLVLGLFVFRMRKERTRPTDTLRGKNIREAREEYIEEPDEAKRAS